MTSKAHFWGYQQLHLPEPCAPWTPDAVTKILFKLYLIRSY